MASIDDTEVRQSWFAPVGRLARWLLGVLTLVGGVTWILLNLHGIDPALDIGIGVVLALGGLVLLMPHRIALPRRATALVVAVSGLGGTAAGLLASRAQVCCDVAYVVDRGWPIRWAQRGAVARDEQAARALIKSANWTVDVFSLAADVLLWAYAGLLLLVVVVLVRRARGDRDGQ